MPNPSHSLVNLSRGIELAASGGQGWPDGWAIVRIGLI